MSSWSIQFTLNSQHPEYIIPLSGGVDSGRIDCTETGNWFEPGLTVLRWTQNAACTQKQQIEVSRQRPALTWTVGFCPWSTYASRKQKKIGQYIFEKEEHCNALNVRVIFLGLCNKLLKRQKSLLIPTVFTHIILRCTLSSGFPHISSTEPLNLYLQFSEDI